jgi:hypothetical protein
VLADKIARLNHPVRDSLLRNLMYSSTEYTKLHGDACRLDKWFPLSMESLEHVCQGASSLHAHLTSATSNKNWRGFANHSTRNNSFRQYMIIHGLSSKQVQKRGRKLSCLCVRFLHLHLRLSVPHADVCTCKASFPHARSCYRDPNSQVAIVVVDVGSRLR